MHKKTDKESILKKIKKNLIFLMCAQYRINMGFVWCKMKFTVH